MTILSKITIHRNKTAIFAIKLTITMNKTIQELLVIKNDQLNDETYRIVVQANTSIETIVPGQFVNIAIPDSTKTFLRRPISIHDVDPSQNSISLLIKAVGDGTKKLVQAPIGSTINTIFPLGKGFSAPKKDEKILLVGGGVGIAPLLYMAKKYNDIAKTDILLGAKTKKEHILLDEFSQYGNLHITTDDGSLGTKGFVVEHAIFDQQFDRIYCCGPEPMMRSVAKKASKNAIDCEVSLENKMACGFGVCLCCVTKTTDGNKCVCSEGPVFNTKDLQWQI